MEWTTAASLAARVGKKAFDHRHTIQRYLAELKAYLDVGATQIVITGHAGAGKTHLAAQMHGRARDLGFEEPAESRTVEVEAITAGAWAKLVRVLPGQDAFRTAGSIEVFRDNASLEGVIHVVDFGFAAPRDPVLVKALIESDKLSTIAALRRRNLDRELEDLRVVLADIRKLLATDKRPKWLVIAVNKIDLFVDQRDAALEHYHPRGEGAFGKVLADFERDVGRQNVETFVLQSCAYEKDFVWNGETAPSGLSRQEHHRVLTDFVRSIASISGARA